jgi:hypothetical protein
LGESDIALRNLKCLGRAAKPIELGWIISKLEFDLPERATCHMIFSLLKTKNMFHYLVRALPIAILKAHRGGHKTQFLNPNYLDPEQNYP